MKEVLIHWPHRQTTRCRSGCDWLEAARAAGFLGGSCGACEIDVNGTTVRACIATVPSSQSGELSVELAMDPNW